MKTLAHKTKHPATQVHKPSLRTAAPMHPAQDRERREIRTILSLPALQCKLCIGSVDDKYEQEANRVAEKIMTMPEPAIQQRRQSIEDKNNIIQTKAVSDTSSGISPHMKLSINAMKSGGQLLPEPTRAFFEPRFGNDFSRVRIHTDTKAVNAAENLKARAFTIGRDLFFGLNQYRPDKADGRRLIAHELTHVVQQGEGINTTIQRLASASHQNSQKISIERQIGRQNETGESNWVQLSKKDEGNSDYLTKKEIRRIFWKIHFRNVKKARKEKHEKWYDGAQFLVTPSVVKYIPGTIKEDGKEPEEYEEGNPPADWAEPEKVTARYYHINGIWTPLEVGIKEAKILSSYLDNKPVKFTYNGSEGPVRDLLECLKDKAGRSDVDINQMMKLINDAVKNRQHIFISAFSQGSIKTNTAVKLFLLKQANEQFKARYPNNKLKSEQVDMEEKCFKRWMFHHLDKNWGKYEFRFLDKEDGNFFLYSVQKGKSKVQKYVHLFYSGSPVLFPLEFADQTNFLGDPVHKLGRKNNNEIDPKTEADSNNKPQERTDIAWHDFSPGLIFQNFGKVLQPCGGAFKQIGAALVSGDKLNAQKQFMNHVEYLGWMKEYMIGKLPIGKLPKILRQLRGIDKRLKKIDIIDDEELIKISIHIMRLGELIENIGKSLEKEEALYAHKVGKKISASDIYPDTETH